MTSDSQDVAQLKQSIFKICGTKFSEHLKMPLDVLRNPVFNSYSADQCLCYNI